MANLSDFLPAAGGGGPFVTDPNELPKLLLYNGGYLRLNYDGVSYTEYDNTSAFWTYFAYTDGNDVATFNASNAYVTLKDISSNKGGFMYFLMSGYSANIKTWRITVDGEEYLIDMGANNGRRVIGPVVLGVYNSTHWSGSWSSYRSNAVNLSDNYGFSNNNYTQSVYVPDIALCQKGAALRFKSTLKIEYKEDGAPNTASFGDRIGCITKTL